MKKYQLELAIESIKQYASGFLHIVLVQPDGGAIPPMAPGQFVEVAVDRADVLLNRPFSIFNRTERELELLVAPIGRATRALCSYKAGDTLRVIGPLGKGFSTDIAAGEKVLLIGGGVGIAPLYYQLRTLLEKGVKAEVLYGMRTKPDAELMAKFEALAPLHVCTDDGSFGFHGLVTQHPVMAAKGYDFMQICGPKPMMRACMHKAVKELATDGEVSLENNMACGLGACLCCVEDTSKGNVCVCKDGPVFNFKQLEDKWI